MTDAWVAWQPKVCKACDGKGRVPTSVMHPTNPNFDGWEYRFCWRCLGRKRR